MCTGLDIGSRTTAIVRMRSDGRIAWWKVVPTGHDPLQTARGLLDGIDPAEVLGTGYGRALAGELGLSGTVTEIKACARGAALLGKDYETVVDIGGQDVKVIRLGEDGAVADFEMNDRCAAGTGRFLEVMAGALGTDVAGFGELAASASPPDGEADLFRINSMCTVFAESEVVSLITAGREPSRVALALLRSIADRCGGMVGRLDGSEGPVLAVGGAARNPVLIELLSERLKRPVHVPREPQVVVATGAALEAMDRRAVAMGKQEEG